MEWLKSREPEADYLLTSRIDNDDEYLPGFVDAVQAECSRGTEILDVRGVQCDGKSYYSIKRAQPNSPFLSLLEPWHDVKTAHFVSHTTMTQFFPARFVGPEILYIQHVHSSNVLNKITGKRLRLDDLTNLPPLPEPSNISDIASALRQPLRYLAQRRSAAPKSG